MDGKLYCKPHFISLFKKKGNYSEGFGKLKPQQEHDAKKMSSFIEFKQENKAITQIEKEEISNKKQIKTEKNKDLKKEHPPNNNNWIKWLILDCAFKFIPWKYWSKEECIMLLTEFNNESNNAFIIFTSNNLPQLSNIFYNKQ